MRWSPRGSNPDVIDQRGGGGSRRGVAIGGGGLGVGGIIVVLLLTPLGGGSVRPDAFTHGTSAQRRRWFTTGETAGDPSRCDTFAADAL